MIELLHLEGILLRLVGGVNYGFEGRRIVGGEVGEHFAVKLNLGFFEQVDESGVAKLFRVGFKSSIDTADPQPSQVAFFVFTTFELVLAFMQGRFFRNFVEPAFGHPKSPSETEDFFVAGMSRGAGFDSHKIS